MTESPLLPQLRAALHQVNDPEIGRPITDLGMVDQLDADESGNVSAKILLTVAGCPMRAEILHLVTAALQSVPGVNEVDVALGVMDDEQRAAMRQVLRGGQVEREIPFAQPET